MTCDDRPLPPWPPDRPSGPWGPRHDGPGPLLAGIVAVVATAAAIGALAGLLLLGWWLA